jgi:NAD(P)-dependent dehydrogenase (short-subunit alcohol dehydrogenase family)
MPPTISKGGMLPVTRTLADQWVRLGTRVDRIAQGFIRARAVDGLRGGPECEKRLLATGPTVSFLYTCCPPGEGALRQIISTN